MTVSRFSILSFLALVLTAIALIPAGAHVFEPKSGGWRL